MLEKEIREKISRKIKRKGYKLIHEDERGKIWTLKVGKQEYALVYTVKAEVRGGDIHKSAQHLLPMKGRIFIIRKKCLSCPDGKGEEQQLVQPFEEAVIEADVPHMVVSFDESLVLQWLEGGRFEKEYYRPFRDKIEGKES